MLLIQKKIQSNPISHSGFDQFDLLILSDIPSITAYLLHTYAANTKNPIQCDITGAGNSLCPHLK